MKIEKKIEIIQEFFASRMNLMKIKILLLLFFELANGSKMFFSRLGAIRKIFEFLLRITNDLRARDDSKLTLSGANDSSAIFSTEIEAFL